MQAELDKARLEIRQEVADQKHVIANHRKSVKKKKMEQDAESEKREAELIAGLKVEVSLSCSPLRNCHPLATPSSGCSQPLPDLPKRNGRDHAVVSLRPRIRGAHRRRLCAVACAPSAARGRATSCTPASPRTSAHTQWLAPAHTECTQSGRHQ
jgi:hypothetical protein